MRFKKIQKELSVLNLQQIKEEIYEQRTASGFWPFVWCSSFKYEMGCLFYRQPSEVLSYKKQQVAPKCVGRRGRGEEVLMTKIDGDDEIA